MQAVHNAIGVLQRRPAMARMPLSADESAALAALYEYYGRGMLGVARRIVRNREDAEDVVQDVFARLPVAIARYREGAFGGWLKQVTSRQALMRVRSATRRREELGLLYLVPCEQPEPGDWMAKEDTGTYDVASLVAGLPWSLRQVVELRYLRGLGHDAIAGQLGITRTASQIRLCRAIKMLRARAIDDRRHAS